MAREPLEQLPPNPQYRDDSPTGPEAETPANNLEEVGYRDSYDGADEDDWLPPTAAQAPKYIPRSVQRFTNSAAVWIKGPQPPRPYRIHPFFPQVQEAPIHLLEKIAPKRKHKAWLLITFYALWLLCFSLVLRKSAFATDVPGYGSPVRIGCTARFWEDGNGCGLNGDDCRPFGNSSFAFRCPANCKRVQLLNDHAVGDQEISYRPLVVGGPTDKEHEIASTVYRGDSFICGSAIHSGFVSDSDGGCGVVERIGSALNFPSSNRNGIKSIEFNSYFPLSFSFVEGTASQCRDLRWPLLGVSLTFTILLSLFTTSPAVFFPSIFLGIFFHVALASDPPSLTDYYSIISIALGRFLPASFCALAIYRFATRPQLTGLTAQVEKTVLWLGGCWVGALNNYTFDKIPIERLTPHDLKQQPGAVPALIIIVLSLFSIALGQAWALRIEGRLPRYLAIYGTFVACLLALVCVPKMNVRIHHYILALLLLPGTAIQNRPSLLYQGILVGLFINGIARWGFDSILQTPFELRGDAKLGSPLPTILPPIIHNAYAPAVGVVPNITFEWALPLPGQYDGVSVLVNEVERYREYLGEGVESGFTWVRESVDVPEYFRFAFMKGAGVADYTKAGTWTVEGGWEAMKAGPG